jgi:ectoine hydroxylase-related dioxygenase (phytanoyl-CoA dioxygenase family)
MPNAELPEDLPGAVRMALPAGWAYLITGRTYHSAGTNRSDRWRRLLIYTYGHTWMRMWDEYRPSPALAAWAETPMRRQLLGLSDPYSPRAYALGYDDESPAERAPAPALPEEEKQRSFFAENGYLMIRGALSGGELAAACAAANAVEARWRKDLALPGTRIPEFEEIPAILEYDPLFFELALHPRIFPLIRELLGDDLALIDHAYYITPPGGLLDGDAWHTDVRRRVPGVNHSRSLMMIRAMIALADIGEDDGATLVLPGSHREPDDAPIPRVTAPEEMPGAVRLTCKAGDAYFFNGNVLHSPGTNRGTSTRRVLLFNYGHKWMRMWQGHEPSAALSASATTAIRRQLLGLTPPYRDS